MLATNPPRRLQLSFARAGGGTELVALRQESPLRALFPRPSAGDSPEAVLVTTSGGLVAGDRLKIEVEVGRDTSVLVTSQAAEKVYRSLGPEVNIDVALSASAGAWLEWLPQETILFDGSRLRRHTVVRLAPSARLLALDMVVFGRQAHGEDLRTGLLIDAWHLYRGERLSWADTLRLEGDLRRRLSAPFTFAGARAMATLIHVASDADAWLGEVRAVLAGAPPHWGATSLPGVLIVRGVSGDPSALRRQAGELAAHLRHVIGGQPCHLPTTWWT
jgi:urease accessory protein